MSFGLSLDAVKLVNGVFQLYPEVKHVKVFGSRAMDTYRPNSDIDLVIMDAKTSAKLARILGDLEELALPYQFDLKCFEEIDNPDLIEHIEQYGKLFFKRDE